VFVHDSAFCLKYRMLVSRLLLEPTKINLNVTLEHLETFWGRETVQPLTQP